MTDTADRGKSISPSIREYRSILRPLIRGVENRPPRATCLLQIRPKGDNPHRIVPGRFIVRWVFILLLAFVGLLGCRQREGQPCGDGDQCALGLYCKPETQVCADRGELLKKKAAETYVYPIPLSPGKGAKGLKGVPVPGL
jgi:hypothetical protein